LGDHHRRFLFRDVAEVEAKIAELLGTESGAQEDYPR
jgi:hypothetical protein